MLKNPTLFFIIVILVVISSCTNNKVISKEEAMKIASSHRSVVSDDRMHVDAELTYDNSIDRDVWIVTERFTWNIGDFGETYTIDAKTGELFNESIFDKTMDKRYTNITISKQAEKFIKKAEKELSQRLINKIEKLETEPVPTDAKVIEGSNKTFRIRVGKYRILYQIYHDKEEILIAKIDHRETVYD